MWNEPLEGFISPANIDNIEDFPQPLGPTIQTNSPCSTEKLKSETAFVSPDML